MSKDTEPNPPWPFKLLRWFCPPQLLEEIEGDLLQRCDRDLQAPDRSKMSDVWHIRRANRRLFWNTLRFFRPGILLRNKIAVDSNPLPMLQNYLTTSLRHIKRSKVNFSFKLIGLSLAVFSFMAIAIYVSYQLSFDTFHEDYEKIYRVTSERTDNGRIEKFAAAPFAIGPMMQQQFPEIASSARVLIGGATYLLHNNNVFDCEFLLETDSSIFNTLTFEFIKGDKQALKRKGSIVLTRTMANIMFGTTDVLQKVVGINRQTELYEVTAVIEDPRPNSHLFFSAFIPIKEEHEFKATSISDPVEFSDASAALYVRFTNPPKQDFEKRMNAMLDPYISSADRAEFGFNLALQPLKDIYLGPSYRYELGFKGSSIYVYAFSVLGVLLLIVAGINYINLAIADFSSRLRETGVRKVLGARKRQLFSQVAIETLLFCFFAVALGLLLLYLLFPGITTLLDSDLRLSMLMEPRVLTMAAGGVLTLIFISTWVPARQLANSNVSQNLKAKGGSYKAPLNQTLLFAQFSISIICIACTVMVGRQIGFIHNKDLGIDRNNLLVMGLPQEFTVKNMQTFKHELKRIAGVTHVSNSSFRIGGGYWKGWYFVEQPGKSELSHMELYEVFSDDELFSTLGIKLLKGRTFDDNIPSDSGAAFVINETAARELGWTDPIGKRIHTHPEEKGKWDGTIVGVVSDINISPLYEKVRPLVMRLPWTNQYPQFFVYIRYQGDEKAIVKAIDAKYKQVMPGYPLMCRSVDELFNSRHQKEAKAFTSLQFATLVIALVSMLGMFSLAAYMSVKRMKEFGIRKVVGARGWQVMQLHLSYFLQIVVVANVIALPIAFILLRGWLNTFAYRIELTLLPFVVVALISALLVLISGIYSAWKAGSQNPVDVIKIE